MEDHGVPESEFEPNAHDVAPGDEHEGGVKASLVGYGVGLAFATILTAGAFILPSTGLVWAPALPVALIVMAIAQMGVHLVFFLHITTGPDNTNNVLALAFGLLIVFLIMAGSLWIMANLNHNMPGMTQVMQMQR
ncbi:MAG: cytochrome o ubiquinol oxidase subunit IV [Caulobacteraceae bacterium]|nr:cytochrome o ubiquinol oxidase subunit IV [Caulobacter sp.]